MDLHGGHVLDDRWFHVIFSSDLSCTRCHTGAYFRFGWDLRMFTEVTCSTIDDFMTLVLLTCRASDAHTGAYFCFGWDLWIFTEVMCSTIDDFISFVLRTYRAPDAILGHITVLDEIYRSWGSCVLILIRETYIRTMIYSLSLQWFLSGASRELPS